MNKKTKNILIFTISIGFLLSISDVVIAACYYPCMDISGCSCGRTFYQGITSCDQDSCIIGPDLTCSPPPWVVQCTGSCSSGSRRCKGGGCYDGDNGATCTVRQDCWSGVHCFEVKRTGDWDDSDNYCVDCDSNDVETLRHGSRTMIYVTCDGVSNTGDGFCESACGADSACDERARAGGSCVVGRACESRGTTCVTGQTCGSTCNCNQAPTTTTTTTVTTTTTTTTVTIPPTTTTTTTSTTTTSTSTSTTTTTTTTTSTTTTACPTICSNRDDSGNEPLVPGWAQRVNSDCSVTRRYDYCNGLYMRERYCSGNSIATTGNINCSATYGVGYYCNLVQCPSRLSSLCAYCESPAVTTTTTTSSTSTSSTSTTSATTSTTTTSATTSTTTTSPTSTTSIGTCPNGACGSGEDEWNCCDDCGVPAAGCENDIERNWYTCESGVTTKHVQECQCYETCEIVVAGCEDFRPSLGFGFNQCDYYDNCDSLITPGCETDGDYCYNVEPDVCSDTFTLCHGVSTCPVT